MVNSSTLDGISTHSAREDGDALKPKRCIALAYFNPLRPRGRRLSQLKYRLVLLDISTHSAREDGDW